MKNIFAILAMAGLFTFSACDNKTTEDSGTAVDANTTTTTTDPVIEVDPDNAVLNTDTTIDHSKPTSTPAGTTTGSTTGATTSGR